MEGECGQLGGGEGERVRDGVARYPDAGGVDEDDPADPVAAEQSQFRGGTVAYRLITAAVDSKYCT
ncbi:hypothetical protein BFF78_02270 [Streptomyces fodineus]|uniref:Uncharacterized protein n=1 Tax=Streptomyces fodineus TaxID=1904616 RepID=A0A1D7Y378_9ACTN|nr:hypothetical protein BFF78_02270 [Streptomyces fodineus]